MCIGSFITLAALVIVNILTLVKVGSHIVIIDSVNKLKDNTVKPDKKLIDVLQEVETNLDKAQEQSRELAAAYSETKVIRSILESRQDTDPRSG